MNTTGNIYRALVALLIVGIGHLAAPSPAKGACVVAYLAVHYDSAPDQELVHPSQCLVPTPFPDYPLTADAGHRGAPLAPGLPSGFSFQIWIPA